ncbi:hypothetical protein BJX68DRAFT_277447 [Aspergillus pseudodeflectus]|uniref:DUF6604 domain-containing protein n=1 Tax=Aspergillus pseudodeflectus TaxID=176178 RepID=A0ABR4JZC9_9EURO
MLPEFLQSSYARYKEDTNTFATWLLETANQCGYQPPTFSATVPAAKKGKSKGKKGDSDDAADAVPYNVTTKDLQKLADVVANSALTVPRSVLTIAKRAIKLRKAVTSWFLGQGDSAGNKGHAHFITALEKICETLEWKINQASGKPDAKKSPQPPTVDEQSDDAEAAAFLNRFAVLTVEEPQDTAAPTQPASPESKTIVKVTVVEEDDHEAADSYLGHLFFKTFCLLQDLHNMRKFLSITWSEYRDGKIDLMNAAVVTDSALRLARDLVKDLEADWRTCLTIEGDDNVQNLGFNLAVMNRGSSEAPSTEIGLPYNKDMADVAEWCYVPTMALLESFAAVLRDNHLPVFKQGHFGSYDPKADRERMPLGERFNEDKMILMSILPEFCMLDAFKVQMPVEDVLTRGLAEFAKTKRVTLWLCFASQIFLDVHHTMRYSTPGTHPPPTFWPEEGDMEIQGISNAVESWIIQDLFLDLRTQSGLDRVDPQPEKHALLSQHPILCGLFLLNLNLRMQFVGQQLVTQWYDVQQLAFLYNLVVNSSPVHKGLQWPDMDTFIKLHGESHIFISSRPTSAAESLQRLKLATGISSAINFARDSRSNTVANLFFEQYVSSPDPFAGDTAGIAGFDTILDQLPQQKSKLESSTLTKKQKQRQKQLQKRPNPELSIARHWSRTQNIGTLHLLAFLKTKLFEEEPVILYNYFGMHKRAVELLRLIRDKEHHKFAQYFTAGYMPDDSFISNIVILIHHVARGSAQNARAMGLGSRRGNEICSRIVVSAADVMRGYLAKNGAVACKELRVFCKNKKAIVPGGGEDYRAKEDADKLVYSWLSLEDVLGPKGVASLQTGIPIA